MTIERNLTARSVILSVLLGTEPPRLPVSLLVGSTELFGISEGTTRTALSRMAAAGEVEVEDGAYSLAAERLRARHARQQASRSARTLPWRDGRWRMAVLGTEGARAAADRAETRTALSAARYAELREGVWLRPDNLDVPSIEGVRIFAAMPDEHPKELADALWDLDGWADEARRLRRRMGSLLGRLDAGDTSALRDGFVVSAGVLRHFQHDPLLPDSLLPAGWPGATLRSEYDRYDAAYRRVLQAWFTRNRQPAHETGSGAHS